VSETQPHDDQDKIKQKTLILQTVGFFAKRKRLKLIKLSIIRQYLQQVLLSEELTLAEIAECDIRMQREIYSNIDLLREDLNIPDSSEEDTKF